MPNHAAHKDGKWRVVESDGSITKNAKGTPVDGGGHDSFIEANKQAQAINISQSRKKS